jgi:hypothetical protein
VLACCVRLSSLPCPCLHASPVSRRASSSCSSSSLAPLRVRPRPLQCHFVSVGAAELRSASSSFILSRPARIHHSSNTPALFNSSTHARAQEQIKLNIRTSGKRRKGTVQLLARNKDCGSVSRKRRTRRYDAAVCLATSLQPPSCVSMQKRREAALLQSGILLCLFVEQTELPRR